MATPVMVSAFPVGNENGEEGSGELFRSARNYCGFSSPRINKYIDLIMLRTAEEGKVRLPLMRYLLDHFY